MSTPSRPITGVLIAFFGPIVWALHFFSLYLTEAVLCTAARSASVHALGVGLTLVAFVALLAFAIQHRRTLGFAGASFHQAKLFRSAGPLTLLSMLAVAWTSLPLFLLPACAPGGS